MTVKELEKLFIDRYILIDYSMFYTHEVSLKAHLHFLENHITYETYHRDKLLYDGSNLSEAFEIYQDAVALLKKEDMRKQ